MSVEISTRAYLPFADARQIGYRIVYGEIRNDDVHKSHDDRTFWGLCNETDDTWWG